MDLHVIMPGREPYLVGRVVDGSLVVEQQPADCDSDIQPAGCEVLLVEEPAEAP